MKTAILIDVNLICFGFILLLKRPSVLTSLSIFVYASKKSLDVFGISPKPCSPVKEAVREGSIDQVHHYHLRLRSRFTVYPGNFDNFGSQYTDAHNSKSRSGAKKILR